MTKQEFNAVLRLTDSRLSVVTWGHYAAIHLVEDNPPEYTGQRQRIISKAFVSGDSPEDALGRLVKRWEEHGVMI